MNAPWLNSYPPGVPATIPPTGETTLLSMIEQALKQFATRPAATCLHETLAYSDLDRLSRAFAGWLQATGLTPGERVALMLPTSLPFLVALAGVVRAGGVVVTVNPLYTAREVELQLQDSGATVIVAGEAQMDTLRTLLPRTAVRRVLHAPLVGLQALAEELGELEAWAQEARVSGLARRTSGELPFADALRAGQAVSVHAPPTRPDAPAFLQYTGGTTGVSKGAVLTHAGIAASTAQQLSWLPLRAAESVDIVTPLPLYHVYPVAIAIDAIVLGAHNRLVPNPRDVNAVIAELKRAPFHMLIGVNTLFNALVQSPDLATVDFSATRLVIGAGASVQAAVAQRWLAAGAPPITEAYGLTETSPSATFNPPGRNGCIGWPVPSTEVRVVDDAGDDVPFGTAGELLIRGPQLFAGYWRREEETRRAMTADGWFRTGDVVVMDAAGCMTLVDRKKDMILVSGFNVYPNEIEGVVAMLPQVLECACIGVPDARSGEAPHLFAVARDPALTAQLIEAHCRRELAAYKVPRHITLVDALPKSTVGKILRRELRQAVPNPAKQEVAA